MSAGVVVVRDWVGLRGGSAWLLVAAAAIVFLSAFLWLGGGSLSEGALAWYSLTNGLNAGLSAPLGSVARESGIPLIAALVFGLLGATSPCQLSTNAAAFAYVVKDGARPGAIANATGGYMLGKASVYGVLGGAALLLGAQAAGETVPVITVVRKALGPIMIVLGLVLLGLLRPNLGLGFGVSAWLQDRVPHSPLPGGFMLGLAFGLAFCPTLFLLFFTLTIPLALASPYGFAYPLVFALGTTLPLLALTTFAGWGARTSSRGLRGFGSVERLFRPAAAVVLLLAGFNDSFVYWFL